MELRTKAELIFVAIVIVVFAIVYTRPDVKKAETKEAVKKALQNPTAPLIKQFKDEIGENHSEIDANSNTIPQAALKDTGLIRKTMLDTIVKNLNLKHATDIMEVTRVNTQLRAENVKLKAVTDSQGRQLMVYDDKWLHVGYHPFNNTADVTYNSALLTAKLSRWKYFPSVTNNPAYDFYGDDPRMRITGVQHLLIEQPDPFFGLKVQARTALDLHSGHIIPSLGVEMKLGPFDVGARYYYSVTNQQWQPIISGAFNLVNIK